MLSRFTALALFLAVATPGWSQTPAAPTPPAMPIPVAEAPKPATAKVSLITTQGPILIEVETERAPITAGNFLHYVDQKRLDGMTFYRAVQVPGMPQFGLVQGGLNNDPRKMLPPIAHESTLQTGLAHVNGTISMARNAPGTAAGDFFFVIGDMPYMDADPTKPGDNLGYAAFGHIVEGMEVVQQMLAAPISQTKGEGGMKGQMLETPIVILSARRIGAPPEPVAASKSTPPKAAAPAKAPATAPAKTPATKTAPAKPAAKPSTR